MLSIRSLTKRYGTRVALDNVSLDLERGECFGLLGPNGAGKSTLLSLVAGLRAADGGSITLEGVPLGAANTQARLSIGFVPQAIALFQELTPVQNLRIFGELYGLRGAVLHERVREALDAVQLSDRRTDRVASFSGGMQRRLNLAASLLHRPTLLLCDEPTVGVDPQSRNCIFEMVESLRAAGTTLIYTTHYMEEAERLCDEIAIIDHGRIITRGSKEQLVEQTFGATNAVRIHYVGEENAAAAWASEQGGKAEAGIAQFKIERPQEIAQLLESAALSKVLIADLQLTRPNLESVFLQLTGKELRA